MMLTRSDSMLESNLLVMWSCLVIPEFFREPSEHDSLGSLSEGSRIELVRNKVELGRFSEDMEALCERYGVF